VTIHHWETGVPYNLQKARQLEVGTMTLQTLRSLRNLEGHHVLVRLGDGSRVDGELVSTARRGASTVWLTDAAGDDRFLAVDQIVEVREA
jgi:hypothetical protein